MAPTGTASGFDQAALARRQALQGAAGPAALVKNAKVFGIACFACLGGLLYGYNQGVFSGVLAMKSFNHSEYTSFLMAEGTSTDKRHRDGHLHLRPDQEGLVDIHL